MDTPMLDPVTKVFTDRSTSKAFAFRFSCDRCGRVWRSTPRGFDPGALNRPADTRVLRMLWNHQHKLAYEQANLEALGEFYYCPACGRRVCRECFCRDERETPEFCRDCLPQNLSKEGKLK